MVRNTFLPNATSTAAHGNAPRWHMDGGRRFAPEGQRNVATGEARSDRCRTRRNPWFRGASADSPGRGGRDASATLLLPGRLLVSVPRAAGSASRRSRHAFTLIELLVTITIITMLAGLVLGGLTVARTAAREMKTKSTIAKLDEIVLRMYAGYANRRVPINTDGMTRAAATNAKNTGLAELMRLEMPQVDTEITNPPTTLPAPPALNEAYKAYRTATGGSAMTAPACLYMIVSLAHPRDMENFSPDEIGMDDNGRPVFVDAWGHAIGFLRAPSGFTDSDIQDSSTLLPLVFSAGQDGQGGLTSTGAADGTGAHYDNIHNHRLDIR